MRFLLTFAFVLNVFAVTAAMAGDKQLDKQIEEKKKEYGEKMLKCEEQQLEVKKKIQAANTPSEKKALLDQLKEGRKCACSVKKEGLKDRIEILKQKLKEAEEAYAKIDCNKLPEAKK